MDIYDKNNQNQMSVFRWKKKSYWKENRNCEKILSQLYIGGVKILYLLFFHATIQGLS